MKSKDLKYRFNCAGKTLRDSVLTANKEILNCHKFKISYLGIGLFLSPSPVFMISNLTSRIATFDQSTAQTSNLLLLLILVVSLLLLLTTSTLLLKLFQKKKVNLKVSQASTYAQNNSDLREFEKLLEEKNLKIEELQKEYEGMTAMLAHDLKNPLNIIFHKSNEIPDDSRSSVQNAGKQMLNILQNVLDLQKYGSGKMPVNLETHNFADILSEAIYSVSYLAQKKEIELVYRSDFKYNVAVDRNILERVVVNLFINLIKRLDQNESIQIRTQNISDELLFSLRFNVNEENYQILASAFQDSKTHNLDQKNELSSSLLQIQFIELGLRSHNNALLLKRINQKEASISFSLPLVNIKKESFSIEKDKKITFVLSDLEKEAIYPFATKMQSHSIFELSKLKSIIQTIPDNKQGIRVWKTQLMAALSSMNEKRFHELITKPFSGEIKHEEQNPDYR